MRFRFLENGSTFTEFGDFSDYDLNDDELYSLLNDIVYEDSKSNSPGAKEFLEKDFKNYVSMIQLEQHYTKNMN